MKGASVLAVASGLLFAPIAKAGGTVQWNIQKNRPKERTNKRATAALTEVITNDLDIGGYFATCTVGTPGQDMILQLDTGSSDIWLPWVDAAVCEKRECDRGAFDPSRSSSFKLIGKGEFDISYVDGSFSSGDYFTDTFVIADTTVSNLTMGIGRNSTIPYGLVGVGYSLNEAVVGTGDSLTAGYKNLPVLMVEQGLIPTNAYSLWLNDLDSNTGNILFGGIDTEKYIGGLTTVDVIKNNATDQYDELMVLLTSMHAVSPSGTDELSSQDFPVQVVLDSGTTLSYVPTDLAEQIWKEVGAVYMAEVDAALLPCSMQYSKGYFSFGFAGPGGPKINVTMDELVLDLVTSGAPPTFTSGEWKGQEACAFGIQNDTSDPFLLGDTFLRSAYVVYDLVNNQIGIAPTDFNSTKSNIVAFKGNGSQIPSATPAPSQSLPAATLVPTVPPSAAKSGFHATSDGATMALPFGSEHSAITVVAVLVSLFGSGLFFV